MSGDEWQALSKNEKLAHWDESARMLRELVSMLPAKLAPSDQQLFEDYLAANELGLAFDVITSTLVEHEVSISRDEFARLEALAKRMELKPAEWHLDLIRVDS
jgi:hypothetical protein